MTNNRAGLKTGIKSDNQNRIKILDIPFDKITMEQAIKLVLAKLKKPNSKPFFIATPNPEMLLESRKNLEFKKILQSTDLNIPDGFGIILTSYLNSTPLPQRVTGTDLMQKICKECPSASSIFLLGAAEGIAAKAAIKLKENNPALTIAGTFPGSANPTAAPEIIKKINNSNAEILFVAFGAPKQELWLAHNLPHLKTVKVAVGVGGAFDFIAGVKRRAPKIMQKTGLEWLFRLIIQPSRIKRIYNAVIKFPIVFLISTHEAKRSVLAKKCEPQRANNPERPKGA